MRPALSLVDDHDTRGEALREKLRTDGFVVCPGLVAEGRLRPILRGLDALLCAVRPGWVKLVEDELTDGLHARLAELARVSRPTLAQVYDAVRKLGAFWALAGSPELLSTASALLESDTVGLAFRGAGIRLDLPGEDRWRSDWHQEYHSQLSSQRAVVAWVSLVHVTQDMGPVQLAKGSHREGILPVRALDPLNQRKDYTQAFAIPDAEAIAQRYERVQLETRPGDVVFLDFATLHASGFNRGEQTRISAQLRYFDMEADDAVAQRWQGGFQEGGDFTRLHPDKVLP